MRPSFLSFLLGNIRSRWRCYGRLLEFMAQPGVGMLQKVFIFLLLHFDGAQFILLGDAILVAPEQSQ